MKRLWYRQDRDFVLAALQRGQRPDLATTTACGPLDELVALHDELGILRCLQRLPVARQRAGLSDALLLRTLATLPYFSAPNQAKTRASRVEKCIQQILDGKGLND